MKRQHWIVMFFMSILCLSAMAQKQVTFGANQNLAEQWVAAKLINVIAPRAGLKVVIQPLPAARANQLNLAGEIDGEICRIDEYAAKNPTLILSKPLYYYLVSSAFAIGDKKVNSTADLAKYKVGIIRGVAHAIKVTSGLKDVTEANGPEQLFNLLNEGRIDIAITSEFDGLYRARVMKLPNIKPVATLAKFEQGVFLNPSNRKIAEQLAVVVTAMKQSGELGKLTAQYEKEFITSGATP